MAGRRGKPYERRRLVGWIEGKEPPPEWVKYLYLPPHWGTPWELERLDNEDEIVSLWIERYQTILLLQQRHAQITQIKAQIEAETKRGF